ncbi:hypothetical protein ACFL7D_11345 [candidate division KSB1 bacterium]
MINCLARLASLPATPSVLGTPLGDWRALSRQMGSGSLGSRIGDLTPVLRKCRTKQAYFVFIASNRFNINFSYAHR